MTRMLIQTQLSNYNQQGKFDLSCDSGWNMMMGRIREMLKLNKELCIDIMGPRRDEDDKDGDGQLVANPIDVNPDMWKRYGSSGENRLKYIPHWIVPNALATRYDFDFDMLTWKLGLERKTHKRYDVVFINDPMLLRNFKALFHLRARYRPLFVCHSHFIDDPSAPKFPTEASLWLGQCEAAIKADVNFWQCQSSMEVFFYEMSKMYLPHVVNEVRVKSEAWDDGYSSEEINVPVNLENMRFTPRELAEKVGNKCVIFVPNRIGGTLPGESRARSSDYTRCGKFMFEILPELRKRRQDFVVIAGNPSQKILNSELEQLCGPNGYVNLVPDALNRDEFKFVANYSSIAVGLYEDDAYGGTVARECIDLGSLPFWANCNEYKSIADATLYPFVCKPDLSDAIDVLSDLIDQTDQECSPWLYTSKLRQHVRDRCSYEATTPRAMKRMGLL